MSNRTLIEINHDYAGNIDGDRDRFAQTVFRYLTSGTARGLEGRLEKYGLRIIAMRHHSEDFRIPEKAEGFSLTAASAAQAERVRVLESAHTPGPWTFEDKPNFGERFVRTGQQPEGGRRYICALPTDNKKLHPESWAELDANARLIAAAPDLLEALQYVLSAHGEQLTDAFEQAHKAIARATGAPQ